MHHITKWELCLKLTSSCSIPCNWFDSKGDMHYGTLQSVQREDGSGKSFNITISQQNGESLTFHVRTVD